VQGGYGFNLTHVLVIGREGKEKKKKERKGRRGNCLGRRQVTVGRCCLFGFAHGVVVLTSPKKGGKGREEKKRKDDRGFSATSPASLHERSTFILSLSALPEKKDREKKKKRKKKKERRNAARASVRRRCSPLLSCDRSPALSRAKEKKEKKGKGKKRRGKKKEGGEKKQILAI